MTGPKSYNSALFCPAHLTLQPCHTYRVSKDLTYSVLQPSQLGEEVTPALGRLLSPLPLPRDDWSSVLREYTPRGDAAPPAHSSLVRGLLGAAPI